MDELEPVVQSEIRCVMSRVIVGMGQSLHSDVVREGHIGLTWNNLVDFCEQTSPVDQRKLITTITEIDLANGDVIHFLNYLVDGMIKSMGLDSFA